MAIAYCGPHLNATQLIYVMSDFLTINHAFSKSCITGIGTYMLPNPAAAGTPPVIVSPTEAPFGNWLGCALNTANPTQSGKFGAICWISPGGSILESTSEKKLLYSTVVVKSMHTFA